MAANMLRPIRANLARRVLAADTSTQCVRVACLVQERSFVSQTLPLFEKQKIQVPSMGDSITEGTIVEWTVAVGEAVKEGDVIALVETDKVTVDIKAEIDGVISDQFGAVDDTVEVGSDLYEIDTDAEATVTASTTVDGSQPEDTAEVAAPEVVAPKKPEKSQIRVPSIQFLGKDGWARRRSGQEVASGMAQTPASPTSATTVDAIIPPMYGRPTFTDDEMEALVLGGASLAPKLVSSSKGAMFE